MRNLKIAVIGAGSTYTPELIEGFIVRRETLDVESIYLMDIDKPKMGIVGALTERILRKNSMKCRVVMTDNLEEAIQGAHYVLSQVRVGKLDARISDEKIPLKYDMLGQETTGAGGFMKAMRTIPVIMDIVKTMERLASDAWLINFANPSGLVAEAVLNNSGIKMAGLCNCPTSMIKDARAMVSADTRNFDYDYVGLNHLSWITGVYAEGNNILPQLIESGLEITTMKNIQGAELQKPLLKATGGIPSSYLNYYYFRDAQINHCKEAEKTRGEVCKELERELLELYEDINLVDKPALLEQRGGAYYSTAAVSLIDALENDKNEYHVVNVRNEGALPFMDNDDVVEVKCLVNRKGIFPVKMKNFNNHMIIGLMKAVKAYEKLAARAGLTGDYDAALSALLVHPLIGDYNKAKPMLDEMLEANRKFLPQFHKQ